MIGASGSPSICSRSVYSPATLITRCTTSYSPVPLSFTCTLSDAAAEDGPCQALPLPLSAAAAAAAAARLLLRSAADVSSCMRSSSNDRCWYASVAVMLIITASLCPNRPPSAGSVNCFVRLLECFIYVCPEPVLVKRSSLV